MQEEKKNIDPTPLGNITTVPESVLAVKGAIDGAAYLGAAFMLFWIGIVFYKLKNMPMSMSMFVIFAGSCCMGVSDLGIIQLRTPAAFCITGFALWMLYSGCAMLVHNALWKKLLPY